MFAPNVHTHIETWQANAKQDNYKLRADNLFQMHKTKIVVRRKKGCGNCIPASSGPTNTANRCKSLNEHL